MFDLNQLVILEKFLGMFSGLVTLVGAGLAIVSFRDAGRNRADVSRWVQKSNLKEQEKASVIQSLRRWRRGSFYGSVAFVLVFVVTVTLVLGFRFQGAAALSRFLARHEPLVFNHSSDGLYDLARVLADRHALTNETSLKEELDGIQATFDLVAFNAAILTREFRPNILAAVERGVRVRVVLMDPTETGVHKDNFDAFAKAIKKEPAFLRKESQDVLRQLQEIQETIEQQKSKGSLEVRLLRVPILYSMWIRDRELETRLAHIGVYIYHGQSDWFYLRFGRNATDLVIKLIDEFEYVWSQAEDSLLSDSRREGAMRYQGLRKAVYAAPDLAKAKDWYTQVLGFAPYFDQPFYVGFKVAGLELTLDPEGKVGEGVAAYWGVENIETEYERLLELGAKPHKPVRDVGEGIKIATVKDPFGNVLGIIFNPNFKTP